MRGDRSKIFGRRFRFLIAPHLAAKIFPNSQGNYCGERPTQPTSSPLTPQQRFARLAAAFMAARMTYANPPRRSDRGNCRIRHHAS